jgi:hypothetical protein
LSHVSCGKHGFYSRLYHSGQVHSFLVVFATIYISRGNN